MLFCAVPLAAQVWEIGNALLEPPALQAGASYGRGLAIADLDGDGIDDLAVGAPSWARPSVGIPGEGGWSVYWGSPSRALAATAMESLGEAVRYHAGRALAAGDFNGDGDLELAIGAPGAPFGPEAPNAGLVLLGEFEARVWEGIRYLTEDDVPAMVPEEGDEFGSVLAVGDFEGDGYDDLVVGIPREDLEGLEDAGAVAVFSGGVSGLVGAHSFAILSTEAAHLDLFGWSLAVGDFDGDSRDDLAVGAPYREEQGHPGAGAVEIYYGSPTGLDTESPQVLFEGDFALSAADDNDHFGHSLAAGEFDESPAACMLLGCHDDLSVGVPGEAVSGQDGAGKVLVGYGGATGLSPTGATLIFQADVGSGSEASDQFGWSLAAGSLDKEGAWRQDLAIGSPYEHWGAIDNGVVHLVFGSSAGLNGSQPAQFVAERPGLASAPSETSDMFGTALAIGDLDDDGWGDLAVYAPGEGDTGEPVEFPQTGGVQILFGALFADGFGRGDDDGWE